MKSKFEKECDNICSARRCLNFKGFSCDIKDCLNTYCPLNKNWEESGTGYLFQDKEMIISELTKSISEKNKEFQLLKKEIYRDKENLDKLRGNYKGK